MATFKVSKETAARALYYLDQHEQNIGQAAHDLDLSRAAIRPYYDTISERAANLLERMRRLNPEYQAKWVATLRAIAAQSIQDGPITAPVIAATVIQADNT